MPTRNAISAYLPGFLAAYFKRTAHSFILRLPLDVHVDNIFIHLCIEDIICLRRVNKAFFLLTHEPVIWKRFLERMNIPVPPLRPTFRYSLKATDFEVEQLVTRAVSLDDNWRKIYPQVCSSQIMMAHYKVLDLKLLPGGKYLVASVRDQCSYRFYIMVFSLDHPKGHKALARIPTKAKAYSLQAKYMKYNEQQGIMIAYTRRTFGNVEQCGIDPSDYSFKTEIDPPYPFLYETVCLHISLDSLELLADPEITPGSSEYLERATNQPPPFLLVANLEVNNRVDSLTLFEFDEQPYMTIIQQPDEVIIIALGSRIISTLVCNDSIRYPQHEYRIREVRVLPNQKDILVIRTVALSSTSEVHLVEIYDAPEGEGFTYRDAKDFYVIENKRVPSFHISDYGIPTTTGDQPKLREASGPPPPISIYFRTIDPVGIIHHVLWPTHIFIPATSMRSSRTEYVYTLSHAIQQSLHISSPHVTHVLPGAYRALMYTVSPDDRTDSPALLKLRRYINPETRPTDYPAAQTDSGEPILRKARPSVPFNVYGSFELPPVFKQRFREGGISAITWDEGIGRVCIAGDDEMNIRILDFAHVVQPDARFARWKRNQGFLYSAGVC